MMISDKQVKNKQTKDSNINTHIFMTIFQRVDFVTYRSPFDITKLFCKKTNREPNRALAQWSNGSFSKSEICSSHPGHTLNIPVKR